MKNDYEVYDLKKCSKCDGEREEKSAYFGRYSEPLCDDCLREYCNDPDHQNMFPEPCIGDRMYHVDEKLPDKTDLYIVYGKNKRIPSVILYNHVVRKWMLLINNQYWIVEGVEYWEEKPEHPTDRSK